MIKYFDFIAYPIMMIAVYVIFGLANWNKDPDAWGYIDRCVCIIWGLCWGFALQIRINRGGMSWR